jgi:predicted AAA+ superfamily ATPase
MGSRIHVPGSDLDTYGSLLRSAPTRHFVDPSLAVAALGADPARLLRDVETLGLLFESLVVRDLRVFAQALDANVFHYRDATGLEVDAIVERRDGTWAAFEVKLGPGAVDDAARSLRRLAQRVDTTRLGQPAALVVVTGWGYGYRRPDGVSVVPIGVLGP